MFRVEGILQQTPTSCISGVPHVFGSWLEYGHVPHRPTGSLGPKMRFEASWLWSLALKASSFRGDYGSPAEVAVSRIRTSSNIDFT